MKCTLSYALFPAGCRAPHPARATITIPHDSSLARMTIAPASATRPRPSARPATGYYLPSATGYKLS